MSVVGGGSGGDYSRQARGGSLQEVCSAHRNCLCRQTALQQKSCGPAAENFEAARQAVAAGSEQKGAGASRRPESVSEHGCQAKAQG